MKLFPKIVFEKRTTKKFEELKALLDIIKNSDKYQGLWEGDTLFITRRIWFQNKITPNIKVEIKNEQFERNVLVCCELRDRFKISIKTLIFILSALEMIIIFSLVKNHIFHILLFVPILMAIFLYLIIYYSYKFECDDFRYELFKILNRA